jgi:hypothetical protein
MLVPERHIDPVLMHMENEQGDRCQGEQGEQCSHEHQSAGTPSHWGMGMELLFVSPRFRKHTDGATGGRTTDPSRRATDGRPARRPGDDAEAAAAPRSSLPGLHSSTRYCRSRAMRVKSASASRTMCARSRPCRKRLSIRPGKLAVHHARSDPKWLQHPAQLGLTCVHHRCGRAERGVQTVAPICRRAISVPSARLRVKPAQAIAPARGRSDDMRCR